MNSEADMIEKEAKLAVAQDAVLVPETCSLILASKHKLIVTTSAKTIKTLMFSFDLGFCKLLFPSKLTRDYFAGR